MPIDNIGANSCFLFIPFCFCKQQKNVCRANIECAYVCVRVSDRMSGGEFGLKYLPRAKIVRIYPRLFNFDIEKATLRYATKACVK